MGMQHTGLQPQESEGWEVDVHSYSTIGPLARDLETTSRALRHYEEEGLIEADRRGTTRIFSPEQRERVLFVIEARRLNIGIADIRYLLSLEPSERVHRKAELLQAAISSLDATRATLASELAKIRSELEPPSGAAAKRRDGPPQRPKIRATADLFR
jgi:DNA-binding transcriptional MerR regulator